MMRHPIFEHYALQGFDTGPSPAERCRFVIAWPAERLPDWQPKRTTVEDEIPGSSRVLEQDLGMGLWTLDVALIFEDAAAFQRFYRQHRRPGTLRRGRPFSLWPGDREPTLADGRTYVEWDDVTVRGAPREITHDARGAVHCRVTFLREDRTPWS